MVRKLQPGILINNRACYREDFDTPEQTITPSSRPWELCDTLGDLWGAAPADLNRKTPREVIRRLIRCVAQSGNMLLNIGPSADGSLQDWQRRTMERVGRWLKVNGEGICGCVGEWRRPLCVTLAPWHVTRKGSTLYFHLLRYPGTAFSVANIHGLRPTAAQILGTRRPLKIVHEPTRDVFTGLPRKPPDSIATVVKVKTRPLTPAERRAHGDVALPDPEAIL